MIMHQKGSMKFPSTMQKLESHLIERAIIVDSYFSTMIVEILENDLDPKTMVECKMRSEWNQWKVAIQEEISSLTKRQVFSQVMPTPLKVFPMGFKWVFV